MEATILLKSVAILSLFYLVYIMAFRRETHFVVRRHFFLIGMICAICLPFVEFRKTVTIELPAMEQLLMVPQQASFTPTTFQTLDPVTTIDWNLLLWVAYSIGIALLVGQLLLQLWQLFSLIYPSPKARIGRFTFVEVSEPCAPFSFFRYIVYNPELHTKEELQMILEHEKIHASQWHTADLLLANLLRMAQWFNPISWFYKKSIEENLEFIADRETAQTVDSAKQYQLALVKASSPYKAPAITTQFYQSFIKKRIIMLNKQTSNRRNILKLGIIVPILCLFLYSFNVQEDIQYVQPEPADTALTQEIVEPVEEPEVAEEVETIESTRPSASGYTTDAEEETVRTTGSEPAAVWGYRTLSTTASDIKIKFHKDLTDSELLAIKKRFKDELGLDMSYTTVRNDAKEITSINISYNGKGRNGNYSISDDEGIEEFYFFQDDDGESGFWSEAVDMRRKERMVYREAERAKRMEEMKLRTAKRKEEHELRRAEFAIARANQLAERDKLLAERALTISGLNGRVAVIDGDGEEVELMELDELEELQDEEGRIFISRGGNANSLFGYTATIEDDDDNIFVIRDRAQKDNVVVITKNTSDSDLLKIKADLLEEGVDFKYNKLKRNSNGEITRIKVTLDDNKGSSSTVNAQGNDGKPISKIVAMY